MTFWLHVLAHMLGGLAEAIVLYAIFKSHKIHIGNDEVDL